MRDISNRSREWVYTTPWHPLSTVSWIGLILYRVHSPACTMHSVTTLVMSACMYSVRKPTRGSDADQRNYLPAARYHWLDAPCPTGTRTAPIRNRARPDRDTAASPLISPSLLLSSSPSNFNPVLRFWCLFDAFFVLHYYSVAAIMSYWIKTPGFRSWSLSIHYSPLIHSLLFSLIFCWPLLFPFHHA